MSAGLRNQSRHRTMKANAPDGQDNIGCVRGEKLIIVKDQLSLVALIILALILSLLSFLFILSFCSLDLFSLNCLTSIV